MMSSIPDFPPNDPISEYSTQGGSTIDLYMEGAMVMTIVIPEPMSSFMPRLLEAQRDAVASPVITYVKFEMLADPNTECPRRYVWADPLLVRSVAECPADHMRRLENEIGFTED